MTTTYEHQFAYQHAFAEGKILNVGCDVDSSRFGARGAVNVDIWHHNPFTKADIPADVLADIRDLSRALDGVPTGFYGEFDSVVVGDLLEHFVDPADITKALQECQKCLRPGGRIILSCPEDHRTPEQQGSANLPMYSPTVRAYHAYPVTLDIMLGWCADAGLVVVNTAHIAYPFLPQTGGWGVVAIPQPDPIPLGDITEDIR